MLLLVIPPSAELLCLFLQLFYLLLSRRHIFCLYKLLLLSPDFKTRSEVHRQDPPDLQHNFYFFWGFIHFRFRKNSPVEYSLSFTSFAWQAFEAWLISSTCNNLIPFFQFRILLLEFC